jgi:hypothetical protein
MKPDFSGLLFNESLQLSFSFGPADGAFDSFFNAENMKTQAVNNGSNSSSPEKPAKKLKSRVLRWFLSYMIGISLEKYLRNP